MTGTGAIGRLFRSRAMWALLGFAFVALLAVGSVQPTARTPAQRIVDLESVLKCPSCADASLAQSETVSANEIKATIANWVHQGLTDRAIEARMVATYGQAELLRPSGSLIWIVPVVVVALAVGGLTAFLLRRRPAPEGISKEDEERVLALLRGREGARATGADRDG